MRKIKVYNFGELAGELEEIELSRQYKFSYNDNYKGEPVSLTMPLEKKNYRFDRFPPFFEGLLPEGIMLENLLRTAKIDANDLFAQLVYVGEDLVGSVTVAEVE